MLEKNQHFTVEITDITSEGHGVCKVDGMAVFVPLTAVGDVIEGKIVKPHKSYAYGICERILTASQEREENTCPVYKKCGGCDFRHISYEAECRTKAHIVENAFRRIGGLNPVFEEFVAADTECRYRNKAQYPVAMVDGKAVSGFYAPRSHRLIPTTDCALQPVVFKEILEVVLGYINARRISVYSEETNTGIIRHIYIRRGNYSGEIMVCVVVRKDISRQLTPLWKTLSEDFPDIRSLVMNINPDSTNVILGEKCITLGGSPAITDTMCGNRIEISPLSFYQINTIQAEKLYAKALEYAAPSENDIIADLYCGAGTIGLSMAHKAKKIVGIEIVPEAVENAVKNALNNGISNADFYCGDAGDVFSKLHKNGCNPGIIVVDPPRKGCSQDSLDVILSASPDRIVMISCNPATAARDAKYLSENGYTVERVCGVDLFPRTKHVECVVLLSRENS